MLQFSLTTPVIPPLFDKARYLLFRESWRMKLDSARNQMMLTNLYLSMLSISVMLATVTPAYLGMNMRHGWEDSLGPFYAVSAFSLAGGYARV